MEKPFYVFLTLYFCVFSFAKAEQIQIQICNRAPMRMDLPVESFGSSASSMVSLMTAYHSASDVAVALGKEVKVPGKFVYGFLAEGLKGEIVELWMDDCSGSLQLVGRHKTDGEGNSLHEIDLSEIPGPGEYQIYQRVVGDNTLVQSTLRVLPEKTQMIVFDIDETLTTANSEMLYEVLEKILEQKYMPKARLGAEKITQFFREKGYQVVYLTARHHMLTNLSREWLRDLDFAPGTLVLAQSVSQMLNPADYKAMVMKNLKDQDFILKAAYGNATTDIVAYQEVGIPKKQTYIMGMHGGGGNTVALGEDFLGHLSYLLNDGSVF